MATKSFTKTTPYPIRGVQEITWSGLSDGDDGEPVQVPQYAEACVQISGTFDTATVDLEGSNDKSTWVTLTNEQGTNISTGSKALETLAQNPKWVRPNAGSGSGSVDVKAILVLQTPQGG